MSMTTPRLSKSRLNAFRQCPKRLWLEVHKPEVKVESAQLQSVYAVGHQVGEIAQQGYPDGILIAPDNDLTKALAETRQHLPSRKPLFEATFEHEGLLIRADLLLPQGTGWHMAEVKSSAKAKDYQYTDLATQVWVAQARGVEITRATVRHIDSQFTLQAQGDYRGLLTDTDAAERVADLLPELPQTVQQARWTLEADEPDIAMGAHCNSPFECPFQQYCSKSAPAAPTYPVLLLPGGSGKALARRLLSDGYEDLQRVPAKLVSAPLLQRIHKATVSGEPYLDSAGAARAMKDWDWPRHYLDFETMGYTVPVWLGTQPFVQVPFQFSCHQVQKDGSVTHRSFLNLSGADPSRACAEALLESIGPKGSIVAYNAGFERGCIHRLADQFADLAPRLLQIEQRVVDLLPVVRANYYHRDMLGSYSIKAVLPALVPALGYDALEGVQDGSMAQAAYQEAVTPGCRPERREQLTQQLLDYCKLDTWAMVELTRALTMGSPASKDLQDD